jgi:hypothetical protein
MAYVAFDCMVVASCVPFSKEDILVSFVYSILQDAVLSIVVLRLDDILFTSFLLQMA